MRAGARELGMGERWSDGEVELNRDSEILSCGDAEWGGLTTDEGLTPAPHRRDRGLAPLSCRLPLKGGVMDENGSRFVQGLRQDRLALNPDLDRDPDRDRKNGLKTTIPPFHHSITPPFHHSIPPNF